MASITKRPGYGYEVRYKEGGKHRSKTFELKKQADTFKRKVEAEIIDGVHIPDGEAVTVEYVCVEFMKHQEQRVRDGRIGAGNLATMQTAVNNDFIPFLGHRKIKDLQPRDVLALYQHMTTRQQVKPVMANGREIRPERTRRGLTPGTARKRIFMMKWVLDFARARGFVKSDIMPTVTTELRGIKKRKIRTFDLDMMKALLSAVEERSPRGRRRSHAIRQCFVYLAAFCGLRIGEIWGLTLDSLHLDAQVIEVRHSLTVKDLHKGPKTAAGNRDVPVPSFLCAILRAWVATYYVPNPRRLVFRMENGAQMRPGTFHTSYWRPLLAQAGLLSENGDDLHFHALRHFASSWMIANGTPVTEVASLLGHESFDMTLGTYAHTIAGGTRRVEHAEQLAGRLLALPSPDLAETAAQRP